MKDFGMFGLRVTKGFKKTFGVSQMNSQPLTNQAQRNLDIFFVPKGNLFGKERFYI